MPYMRLLNGRKMKVGFVGSKRTVILFACPWCGYEGDTFMHTDADQSIYTKKCGDCENLYFSTFDYEEKDYDKFLTKLMEEM